MNNERLNDLRIIEDNLLNLTNKNNLETELNIVYNILETTRYANSQIIQNMQENQIRVSVRVASGKKLAEGSTTDISDKGLTNLIIDLQKSMQTSPDIPYFTGLNTSTNGKSIPQISMDTPSWNIEQRSNTIASIISIGEGILTNIKLAGTCTTNEILTLFSSSSGFSHYYEFRNKFFKVNAIAEDGDKRGYGQQQMYFRKNMPDFEQITEKVVDTAKKSLRPISYGPGEYKVVLGPEAVSELLDFIQMTLEANAFHEGRSFATDSLGAELFDSKFHLVDSPLNSDLSNNAFPIDSEGSICHNNVIIDHGSVVKIPYSSLTASKYLSDKNLATGNFIKQFRQNIAVFVSVIQKSGKNDLDDLFKDIGNGLYIDQFWYTRFTDTRKGGLTGLTRNGLFEIKNGELTNTVTNLRYTDSFLSIFGPENIISIGKELLLNNMNTTSAMAINKFNFSSKAHTV
ncbi:MAG: metallopeptidase TldD-related protein [Candidatus Thorarchaeota archaeon]